MEDLEGGAGQFVQDGVLRCLDRLAGGRIASHLHDDPDMALLLSLTHEVGGNAGPVCGRSDPQTRHHYRNHKHLPLSPAGRTMHIREMIRGRDPSTVASRQSHPAGLTQREDFSVDG